MTDHERLPDPATRTEGEGETLDMPEGFGSFSNGQVLGERYQILEMLGRGAGVVIIEFGIRNAAHPLGIRNWSL